MPIATRSRRTLALLAPDVRCVPSVFERVEPDDEEHATRLAKLQRLRGGIYLEDGAIEPWQLTEDGRHSVTADETSWHLLSLDEGEALGCARLQVHTPNTRFAELTVASSALAQSSEWQAALRSAVTAELRRAQVEKLRFIEAGGWAITPELRCTTEALHIALGSYALGELLGGSLGLSTATTRHHSASILRRMGASSLMWDNKPMPSYYDPAYGCEMEVVRFDSRLPSPKYRLLVEQLKTELSLAQVFCRGTRPQCQPQLSLALANSSGRR